MLAGKSKMESEVGRGLETRPKNEKISSTRLPVANPQDIITQIVQNIKPRTTTKKLPVPVLRVLTTDKTIMSHDAEDDEATYGNNHRAFLQALLARQTLTFEQAKPLISSIRTAAAAAAAAAAASTPTHAPSTNRVHLPSDITPEDFLLNYIHPLNSLLSPFDLEIRRTFHQLTREEIFALVNTTSDAMTQMATMHSPDEIAYVKRLLDAMFEANNTVEKEVMAVHAVQARGLARVSGGGGHGDDGGKSGRDYHNDNGDTQFSWNHQNNSSSSNNSSLTQSQAEKVLEAMELEGWFEKSTVVMGGGGSSSSRNERRKVIWYTLTPRALMELQQWLVDTYNHEEEEEEAEENEETHQKIKFCKACRQIVTMGQRCPKMTCNVRLHHDCVGKMFRAQRDHETCPTCKTDWQDAPLVGIEAVKEPAAAAAAGGRRKSRNGTTAARNGGRRRSAASTVNGYDEEEEGEGEEEGDGEVDGELP